MKAAWQTFVRGAGGTPADPAWLNNRSSVPELPVATTGEVLCDLTHLGLVIASGSDAQTFLQGQLTCDVREVDDQHSRLGAHLSRKGRMLALMRLFKHNQGYALELPEELVSDLLAGLGKYVLRAKVSLADGGDALVRMGYSGPAAAQRLSALIGDIPQDNDEVTRPAGLTVIRLPGPHPRFEIVGDLESSQRLWASLLAHAAPVGPHAWGLLDILAGIPSVRRGTVEAFVPQMVNLPALKGVSFVKGCYTGQEVVARTEYLGKLKRRMYLAHLPSETSPPPLPGDPLYARAYEQGQGTGKVVDAQASPDGGYDLLVVVQVAAHDSGLVHLGSEEGPSLEFRPLPYEADL